MPLLLSVNQTAPRGESGGPVRPAIFESRMRSASSCGNRSLGLALGNPAPRNKLCGTEKYLAVCVALLRVTNVHKRVRIATAPSRRVIALNTSRGLFRIPYAFFYIH